MKKKKKKMNRLAISTFICILFISAAATMSESAVLDRVIAVVNDELITQSELDRILQPIYAQYKKLYAGDELLLKIDEKRREILNHMINDKLILTEARKQEIEIKPEEISKRVEEFKGRFPSEEQFEQALIEQGVTQAELQKRFEEELLKEKFISREVRNKIEITPPEIKAHYDANMNKFKVPPRVRVSDILIRTKGDKDKEKALEKAKEVLARLKEGDDFAEMAKVYSEGVHTKEGGDMGYIIRGQLKKELDDVIFALKEGEFSDITESGIGYHIFMVSEKQESVVISFEEAYDKIRDVIYRQKARKRLEELIEEIKENAYISIK